MFTCCACGVPVDPAGLALDYREALCSVRPDSAHKAVRDDMLDDTCFCGRMSSAPDTVAHPAWCPNA